MRGERAVARRSLRRRAVLGVGALAVALGAGAGTHALWSDAEVAGAASLRVGDLDVVLGAATWSDASSDVAETPIDPATFLAMPGDVVVLTQDFVTVLVGDNLAGELFVHWADGASVPVGVSVTYQIHDDAGAAVRGPVAVGESVALEPVPVGEAAWSLTVELVVHPEVAYAQRPVTAGPVPLADLGVVLELRQVRPGRGFGS